MNSIEEEKHLSISSLIMMLAVDSFVILRARLIIICFLFAHSL